MEKIKNNIIILNILIVVYTTSSILAPFITGFLLAYVLYPVKNRITKYTENSMVSSIFLVVVLSSILGLVSWVFLHFIYGEFLDVLSQMPPPTKKLFQFLGINLDVIINNTTFNDLNSTFVFQDLTSKIISYFFVLVYKVLNGNFSFLMKIFSFGYLTPLSTIIFLANIHYIPYVLKNNISETIYSNCYNLIINMNYLIKKYLHAQLIISIVQLTFYYVMLNAIHINRKFFVLCIVFFSSFIPSFGSLCGLLSFLFIAFIENTSITPGLTVFIIGYLYENNCLIPTFMGNSLGISGFIIWCSVILGGKLFGVLGLLFSIPIGATIYNTYLKEPINSYKKDKLS